MLRLEISEGLARLRLRGKKSVTWRDEERERANEGGMETKEHTLKKQQKEI